MEWIGVVKVDTHEKTIPRTDSLSSQNRRSLPPPYTSTRKETHTKYLRAAAMRSASIRRWGAPRGDEASPSTLPLPALAPTGASCSPMLAQSRTTCSFGFVYYGRGRWIDAVPRK